MVLCPESRSITCVKNIRKKLIKDAEKIAAQQAEEAAKAPKKEVGFISVSIGEGFGQIFRDLGVDYLIEGGQTMNRVRKTC